MDLGVQAGRLSEIGGNCKHNRLLLVQRNGGLYPGVGGEGSVGVGHRKREENLTGWVGSRNITRWYSPNEQSIEVREQVEIFLVHRFNACLRSWSGRWRPGQHEDGFVGWCRPRIADLPGDPYFGLD